MSVIEIRGLKKFGGNWKICVAYIVQGIFHLTEDKK